MKYIKTYEKNKKKQFWFIPYINSKLIQLALTKLLETNPNLNITKKEIIKISKSLSSDTKIGILISTASLFEDSSYEIWYGTTEEELKIGMELFSKYAEYQGEITLEDWEIDANKYNL